MAYATLNACDDDRVQGGRQSWQVLLDTALELRLDALLDCRIARLLP